MGLRSWMTTLESLNNTVETKTSPSCFFYLLIKELKPPIVSFSKPHIDPLRSKIKTISVQFFFIPVSSLIDYSIAIIQIKMVALKATFIRQSNFDQTQTTLH